MIYVKLSGDIVFKHQVKISNTSPLRLKKELSALRIIVLNEGRHFHLVVQYRAGLLMVEKYQDGESEKFQPHSLDHNDIVYSDHEDSNWYVQFTERDVDFDKLVLSIQRYCRALLDGNSALDLAYKKDQNQNYQKSHFFNKNNVYPLELSFYQKMLSLGLNSQHYPFNVDEQTQ